MAKSWQSLCPEIRTCSRCSSVFDHIIGVLGNDCDIVCKLYNHCNKCHFVIHFCGRGIVHSQGSDVDCDANCQTKQNLKIKFNHEACNHCILSTIHFLQMHVVYNPDQRFGSDSYRGSRFDIFNHTILCLMKEFWFNQRVCSSSTNRAGQVRGAARRQQRVCQGLPRHDLQG